MADRWADVRPKLRKDKIEDFYEIGDLLGSGSFAEVKRGKNKQNGEIYAIKMIEKKTISSPDRMDMVFVEMKILLAVDHDNIVRLKEIFEGSDVYYIVLELISGGELFDKIVQLQFYSEKDASRIIRQVLAAVQHLHERNIIHRDLKPENLLLSSSAEDANIKLADFGLSEIVDGDDVLLKRAVGTPGYIAPEVLLALEGGAGYNKPVDLWGIGVILYILLCGFPPFYDEDEEALYDSIIVGKFTYPEPYWTNVSDSAKDLINRMLVVDPAERLTAAECLNHPWVQGSSAPDKNLDGTVEELKKFRAKQKFKGAILATMALKKLNLKKLPFAKAAAKK
eukprot:TRINITY_DN1667_c0_g1_i1.p1 TRINITY_DN1667_c0_g1~~TRINITY_DN1667_c0_g1_i1.p1  ORF type:complete len:366 (-),score=157.56 TRINITY_DN1667_c0_g1_i1:122-1135(-)